MWPHAASVGENRSESDGRGGGCIRLVGIIVKFGKLKVVLEAYRKGNYLIGRGRKYSKRG